jgi:hypothetical protein
MKHVTNTRRARIARLRNRALHACRQVRRRKRLIVSSGVTVIAI